MFVKKSDRLRLVPFDFEMKPDRRLDFFFDTLAKVTLFLDLRLVVLFRDFRDLDLDLL